MTRTAGVAIRGQFSTEINVQFSLGSMAFWRRFEHEMGIRTALRLTTAQAGNDPRVPAERDREFPRGPSGTRASG